MTLRPALVMRPSRAGFVAVALLASSVVGCSSDTANEQQTIHASLVTYAIALDHHKVHHGTITFDATNDGGWVHEVEILTLPLDKLPLKADGSVDEDKFAPGVKLGEVEKIQKGETKSFTVDLPKGTYSLVCNFDTVLDGHHYPHFKAGMSTVLEVT